MKDLLELLAEYAAISDYDDGDYTTEFKTELDRFLRWANRNKLSS